MKKDCLTAVIMGYILERFVKDINKISLLTLYLFCFSFD